MPSASSGSSIERYGTLTATPTSPVCGPRPGLAERFGDHVQRQRSDQRRPLDMRDELGRGKQPSLRVKAPDESLDTLHGARADVEHGLVVDDDLVLLQRRLEFADDAGIE